MSYVVRHGKRIEVETLETVAPPARPRRVRVKETFARIPHQRGMELYGRIGGAAWVILLELDRLIYKSFGRNPVRLANHNLEAVGMPRNTKWKALRQLEAAGVIAVVQEGQEAALVTHNWHPLKS
jgi:hypothetical protein